MKKPLLWMLISGLIGITAAWLVNNYRYGTTARFGSFDSNGRIVADAVASPRQPQANHSGNPKAVVVDQRTSYDFGIMSPGAQGEQEFLIANHGQSELKLRLGASTCKCTIGALESESVAPGEQTSVTLSWTVKPDEANFSQSAQILTNDPAAPALTFSISGKIVRDVAVVPDQWNAGDVAAGDSFTVSGTVYNFMDHDIDPIDPRFNDARMTELASFSIEPFTPTEQSDGVHASARQGFRVTATIAPGLRQGAFTRQLIFAFHKLDDQGNRDDAADHGDGGARQVLIPVSGSVVGPLGLILNDQIKQVSDSYIYDLGRIRKNDPLTATIFVVLKGKDHDNAVLTIGEVSPDGVIKATLGDPKGSGATKLYPLQIELNPAAESVERKGLNKDDYGWIWVESDTPKVASMRVLLKFSLDAR